MTSISVPAQGGAGPAGGAALASERNAANQRGAQDGSAFVALLGAFDDAGAQPPAVGAPAPANGASAAPPATQSAGDASPLVAWRSISAVHSLGSGVLVAMDKRFAAAGAQDAAPAPATTPRAKSGDSADASAPMDGAWAALLLGAAGVVVAPKPGAASTVGQATETGAAGQRGLSVVNEATMPTDGAHALSTPTIALSAGAPQVEAKVVRSITYLGLDPATRAPGLGRGATGAQSASAAGRPVQTGRDNLTPLAVANAGSNSLAAPGGEQPGQNMPNGGANGHGSGKAAAQASTQTTSGAPAADAAAAAQTTPGATPANGVALVQIGQLADFFADAASAMDPRADVAPAQARATAGPSDSSAGPVKELDVQLNPESLGALSIQMRLSNGSLNITITAGNADTRKLISSESDAISDKLKSLNFSVESITVKALDIGAPTGAGGEAGQSGTPAHGEPQQDQSGQTADGSARDARSFNGDSPRRNSAQPEGAARGEPGGDGNPGHRFV